MASTQSANTVSPIDPNGILLIPTLRLLLAVTRFAAPVVYGLQS
ncbi:hypothetical protein LvStA_00127 [Burkholderia gladioli]|nr:hypothetical protein LvStA_00127 [Burkholderia gladioli]